MCELSHISLFVTPWTIAHQAPLSMEFSKQGYWSGLPFPSPGDLPNPGIEARSPALRADSLPSETSGKPEEPWEEPNLDFCRWALNIVTCIFTRERQTSFEQKEALWPWRRRSEWYGCNPRNPCSHQNLEKVRKRFSPRAFRGNANWLIHQF